MSDDTDDAGGGTLVRGPWSGDSTYTLPPIPDFIDTIPPPEDIPAAPPESPEEATMQLPPIPAAPDPATALRSEGMPTPEIEEDESEYEEGEYAQPRSLADRLGDWLELRLEIARATHEGEAPFREAEIARKVALMEGRTAQDVALMEQNRKLHTARMKAKGDKAAARGKADAAKSPSSGLGADKGRSKAGGGGGSPRGGGGAGSSRTGPGSGRGSNSGGIGGRSGSASGAGGGGKGGQKGPDRSSGGRSPGPGRAGSGGGSKGSHSGPGGSGRGSGHRSDSGRAQHNGPVSNARAERARGRADRAAARQAGRQERRTAGHSAGVADRSRGRDQARANRQQEWQDRRAKRAEREAAQQAKRGAATPAATGRTTLGGALGEEAQRRWDERRGKAAKRADAGKVDLTKNKKGKPEAADRAAAKEAPDGASSAGRGTPAGGEPGKGDKAADGVSGAAKKRRRSRRRTASSGRTRRRGRTRRTDRAGRAGGTGRRGRAGRSSDGRFGPEPAPTVEWPDHPARPPRTAGKGVDDDVVDADIVPDAPAAMTTGAKGLPPAPEQHTQRPGTSRPTAQEDPVAAQVSKPPAGQTGMAARHRTDITFGEYLTAIVNIAIAAGADAERAQDLAAALGRVADALRDMAADLVGDHNIATEVIDRITDLADAADRMKALAERCATECEIASEAALLAAKSVGRVYGEDMQAMDDAGLARASSAAHHD